MPRGRPKGSKNRTTEEKTATRKLVEAAMNSKNSMNGTLVVSDPLKAAALARHPKNTSAKEEVPFPDDWDKMGKIQRLEWLTANPRK
jgi:hypothetical protein